MKRSGNCGSCSRGIKVNINGDILCKIHGIVSKDFYCSKFARKVDAWPLSERKPKCIECEFFIVSDDKTGHDAAIGYCQLFTVRNYNGVLKSACSKFCRKSERNIS